MTGWLVRIALFALFLIPVVIEQYSVNYLFVAFAAFLALQARGLKKPSMLILVAIAVYVAIFLCSIAIDLFGGGNLALRRSVSFAIFISIFAFSVVDFEEADVRAFKIALISVAVAISLQSLLGFFLAGGNTVGFGLKNVVGSQRYGFVYLLALFVLIRFPTTKRWELIAKYLAGYVIMTGVLLTFSRASIFSLGLVLPLYFIAPLLTKSGRSVEGGKRLARRLAIGLAYCAALYVVLPVTFEYYDQSIFNRYTVAVEETLAGAPVEEVFVPAGSEGARLTIWSAVAQYVSDHPFLGGGYLGSWSLNSVVTGSAHNQYFDVLMRTGFVGTVIYLLVLGSIFLFLWRKDQGLFWGGLTILVYGLVHETFKESQGAFILAFLIGMYATDRRSRSASSQISMDGSSGQAWDKIDGHA
ncbi:MAG: O-antigen ligase family protein [Kaiparowitsia implicata GSE-PSE-MK54-09C]|jgi:O-antigen ligase|nr:O-antigen ligase family protein [Kaiparowitsia implicata GSE-PSE-MK54-09C]